MCETKLKSGQNKDKGEWCFQLRGACWDAEGDLRAGGEARNQHSADNLNPEPTVGKVSLLLAVS